MVSKKKKKKKKNCFSFSGKTDMVLGKKVAIFYWNGAEIQPKEMGRKSPAKRFLMSSSPIKLYKRRTLRGVWVKDQMDRFFL